MELTLHKYSVEKTEIFDIECPLKMILDLKIQDNVVFAMNEQSKEWEAMPIAMISEMEDLLAHLESFNYPTATKRENMIFEEQYDIATGFIKAFKDEDGDLTVTYRQTPKPRIEVDEDAAFGMSLDDHPANMPVKHPVNHWETQSQGADETGAYKALLHPSNTEVNEIGSLNGAKNASVANAVEDLYITTDPKVKRYRKAPLPVHKMIIPDESLATVPRPANKKRAAIKTAICLDSTLPKYYKKRPLVNAAVNRRYAAIRAIFLAMKNSSAHKQVIPTPVSYIKRKLAIAKEYIDPDLLINSIRYNIRNKIKNAPESNFYLEPLDMNARGGPMAGKKGMEIKWTKKK